MKPAYDYEKDAAAIYRRSFAIIRAEADLKRFPRIEERVAVRVIHACGMVEAAGDLVFSAGAGAAAREALHAGAPIFCDARMVAEGVTRARLPAHNDVVCTLADPSTPTLAAKLGTTRTAAAIELWLPRLGGCRRRHRQCADRALPPPRDYRRRARRRPPPSSVCRSASSARRNPKEALIESGLPAIVVRGRKGGSAMAAAAVNALASDAE